MMTSELWKVCRDLRQSASGMHSAMEVTVCWICERQ
jgi:hypothetical protein